MEEQVAAIVAQNADIIKGIQALHAHNGGVTQAVQSLVSRVDRIEKQLERANVVRGGFEASGGSGAHRGSVSPSSSSAETHVMVEDGNSASRDHVPAPPNFRRGEHGESPLMSRSLHQDSDPSFAILKDPNIKMVPPKVVCKDPSKIKPKEFLEYFENVYAFIANWENQPGNKKKKLKFDDADTFALRNLSIPEQKQLSKLIKTIFDDSELKFVAPENRSSVIFWEGATTSMAKAKLCDKLANASSLQNCTLELMRIKFVSPYGLIDPDAFDDYKKKILECIAAHSHMGFDVPIPVVKDAIISALPDASYKRDLFLLFGPEGMMYGHQSLEFLISAIELRISSVMSQNLHAVVNRAVAARDAASGKKSGQFKVNVAEMDDAYGLQGDQAQQVEVAFEDVEEEQNEQCDDAQAQLLAFLADTVGKKTCDRTGVAPDGKLKCKFLGGPKASCIFSHPASDMQLKGKGFSIQGSHASSARGGQSKDL